MDFEDEIEEGKGVKRKEEMRVYTALNERGKEGNRDKSGYLVEGGVELLRPALGRGELRARDLKGELRHEGTIVGQGTRRRE